MSTADLPGAGTRGWPQLLALVVGLAFLVVGLAGFAVTGFADPFGNDRMDTLAGFMVNPAHNVVHVLIGAAGIALSRTLRQARTYGWLLAVGYGAAFVYGLIAVGEDWDFLNLNWADNILHLVTAVVGVVIALGKVHTVTEERGMDASLRPER